MVSALIQGREDTSIQDESWVRATGLCPTSNLHVKHQLFKMWPSHLEWDQQWSPFTGSQLFSGSSNIPVQPLPQRLVASFFFPFYSASNEVIVYSPTRRFLGDSSLSSQLWRNLTSCCGVESRVQRVNSCRRQGEVSQTVCVCLCVSPTHASVLVSLWGYFIYLLFSIKDSFLFLQLMWYNFIQVQCGVVHYEHGLPFSGNVLL